MVAFFFFCCSSSSDCLGLARLNRTVKSESECIIMFSLSFGMLLGRSEYDLNWILGFNTSHDHSNSGKCICIILYLYLHLDVEQQHVIEF